MNNSRRVFFENANGVRLGGIIEQPTNHVRAVAIFTHCFTCTKDLKAIVRISRRLATHGLAVLRFDFAGLGDSRGRFAETNFDTNLIDLRAAVHYLAEQDLAPQLLIGHSLGAAAIMTAAPEFLSVRGVTTINAPSSTEHLANHLSQSNPEILSSGEGTVEIGGREFLLKRQLIDSLRRHDLPESIRRLRLPHLIFHSLLDQTLPYWHAEKLFQLTSGPKSLISLSGADHLLVNQPQDVNYVADLINIWSQRNAL